MNRKFKKIIWYFILLLLILTGVIKFIEESNKSNYNFETNLVRGKEYYVYQESNGYYLKVLEFEPMNNPNMTCISIEQTGVSCFSKQNFIFERTLTE